MFSLKRIDVLSWYILWCRSVQPYVAMYPQRWCVSRRGPLLHFYGIIRNGLLRAVAGSIKYKHISARHVLLEFWALKGCFHCD